MRLDQAIPAMPVRDMSAAVDFYRDRLGFAVRHQADDYGVLARDDAEVHRWGASDETWRERDDLRERPYGTQEFFTLDQDGNLLTFFCWVSR